MDISTICAVLKLSAWWTGAQKSMQALLDKRAAYSAAAMAVGAAGLEFAEEASLCKLQNQAGIHLNLKYERCTQRSSGYHPGGHRSRQQGRG